MSYVDLRPYKPKAKKEEEVSSVASVGSTTTGDFLANLAEAGKQEQSVVSNKDEVIEILNLLNEKLSSVEEKLFRIERKLENEKY